MVPSNVCWSIINKLLLSTSSPNVMPSAAALFELWTELPAKLEDALLVRFCAMVLALGWRGWVELVVGSRTSIRIEITPNVWVDS